MAIRQTYHNLARRKHLGERRSWLANHEVSILSSSCAVGVIYHDLGFRFMSPTINLFMRPDEFVHYKGFGGTTPNWGERSTLVDYSNCCMIMVDRYGCMQKVAKRFDALPIENKSFPHGTAYKRRCLRDCESRMDRESRGSRGYAISAHPEVPSSLHAGSTGSTTWSS